MSTSEAQKKLNSPTLEDPRWQLVERILQTEDFLRAPRLAEFLRYICRLSLEGRGPELHEQQIGAVVFGRSAHYDSSADTVVRSNALRLRRRLDEYFLRHGDDEPLRIEIPRGGYVPRFYPAKKEARVVSDLAVDTEDHAISSHDHPPSISESPQKARFHITWIEPFVAGIFLTLAVVTIAYLFGKNKKIAAAPAQPGQSEIERRFWNSIFPQNGKTIIVPGDSGLVLYETYSKKEVSLSDYLGGAYRDSVRASTIPSTSHSALISDLASRRYTSIVDLDLASQLSRLPEWSPQRTATVFARDLIPSDADSSNLILIGSKEANPWVSLVEPSMNFVLMQDKDKKSTFHFLNRHPQSGELAEYAPKQVPNGIGAPVVYGDVAYLPNPSGNGKVLVLNGLWMSGTQSAGDFVLDGTHFSDWLKSIARKDGTIPFFEILIATRSLQDNATASAVIAKRIYAR